MFSHRKKSVWSKKDNSRKGKPDSEILGLLQAINRHDGFYTTSSCSGRVIVLCEPATGKKKDCRWLYVSHTGADDREVMGCLGQPAQGTVWLKMEPFILHTVAKDNHCAGRLLACARKTGLKHSGILSLAPRLVVEIAGNESMSVPLGCGTGLFAEQSFVSFLVETANRKLRKNHAAMQKFLGIFAQEFF